MTGERLVQVLRAEARRVAAMPARLRRSGATVRQPAGDRYSRRVALLKRVLPAVGVALLLLVAAWPRLAPLIDLHVPGIDLREARELKMVHPRYAGVDRLNRPYVVTAASERQVPDRSDLMSLETPKADMLLHHGTAITIAAATGIYQSQAQLLDLTNDVVLTHQDGTRFLTHSAHVDFADNTAEGHEPVTGHGPAGDISGAGFRILARGDTIIFTGKSAVRLNGTRPGTAATAPPTLPAAITEAADRLAATAASEPAPAAAEAAPHQTTSATADAPKPKSHTTRHALKEAKGKNAKAGRHKGKKSAKAKPRSKEKKHAAARSAKDAKEKRHAAE